MPTSVQSAPHLVEVVVVVVTVVVVVVVVVVEVVVVTVVVVVVVAVVVVPMQPQGFASYKAKWKIKSQGWEGCRIFLNEDKRSHLARNWVTGDPAEGETLDGAGLSAWSICI